MSDFIRFVRVRFKFWDATSQFQWPMLVELFAGSRQCAQVPLHDIIVFSLFVAENIDHDRNVLAISPNIEASLKFKKTNFFCKRVD